MIAYKLSLTTPVVNKLFLFWISLRTVLGAGNWTIELYHNTESKYKDPFYCHLAVNQSIESKAGDIS